MTYPQIYKALDQVGKLLIDELIKELAAQGHIASGKLRDSFMYVVTEKEGGYSLEVKMKKTGVFVENGRRAGKLPPVSAIEEWVKIRKIDVAWNKPARSAAWAIAMSMKKHGVPSPNSISFSSTGKRTEFIHSVMNAHNEKITGIINNSFYRELDIQIENAFKYK